MKLYKVVTKQDYGFYSATICSMSSPKIRKVMALTYAIGQTTVPRVGKIFTFSRLTEAKRYADTVAGTHIFVGEGKLPTLCECRLFWGSIQWRKDELKSCLENFWSDPKLMVATGDATHITYGRCYAVESFRPEKVVYSL